jgi:hypothetical protein
LAALDSIIETFAKEIAPERQRVREGELSQGDFGPLREEATDRAERRAADAGAETWELYRSMLAERSLHWADRWLAANRLHDPSIVPESATADITAVIEGVLRDPATRSTLMLHVVMAAGILRGHDPAIALYPVSRATIDEAVVPYVERGSPGEASYEGQMRNLQHSLHLLATLVRLTRIHRERHGENERGVYQPLLIAQLERMLTLYEANREAMVAPETLAPDGSGTAPYFEPAHVMEHLAEALEEAERGDDGQLIDLFTERQVPALFEQIDEVCASLGRAPARIDEFRRQVEVFSTAAARR